MLVFLASIITGIKYEHTEFEDGIEGIASPMLDLVCQKFTTEDPNVRFDHILLDQDNE